MGTINVLSNNFTILTICVFVFVSIFLIFFKVKYDLLLIIHTCLLSIAILEPSPADLLFILLLFFSFKYKAIQLDELIRKIKDKLYILLFFVIYIFCNFITTLSSGDLLSSIKFSIVTVYLVLYSIFIYTFSNKSNFLRIVKAYIISSTFSAMIGIIGFLFWPSSFLIYNGDRIRSFFKDPNVLGPFLIPAIIFMIDDLMGLKVLIRKPIISVIIITINTLALILSFSRSAWIILFLSVCMYFILNIKKVNLVKLVGSTFAILLLILALWSVLPYNLKTFFIERAQFQSYDISRFTVQRTGLSLAVNKVVGYGPGQFETVVGNYLGVGHYSAHNLYVRVLLETGIAGFISLIIPLAYILIKLLICHIKKRDVPALKSSVLITILFGMLLNSLVIDTLHWRHFWLFIGLSLSLVVSSRSTSKCIIVNNLSSKKKTRPFTANCKQR